MSLLQKARKFADEAHEGQTRKYTDEPYVHHPVNVAMLLLEVPHDDAMLCAALLHDVVEDCNIEMDIIFKEFGGRIGGLVEELTDVSLMSDGNRAVRKQIDLEHTAKASPDAQTIKLADLIDNSESIIKYDPGFAPVFMNELQALMKVLTYGEPKLYGRALEINTTYVIRRSNEKQSSK